MDFVDRFSLLPLILSFLVYPLFAAPLLKWAPQRYKMKAFAVLNVCGLAVLCLLSGASSVRLRAAVPYAKAASFFFIVYVLVTVLQFLALRRVRREGTLWPTLALLGPILFLVYAKYAADYFVPFGDILASVGIAHFASFFIGISYLSFRLVHLAQEVRNEFVEIPTIWEYLAFAFFIPTLSIGPINPYSKFIHSFREPDRKVTPALRSLLRIVVGFTKYMFLGSIAAQFTYAGLLRDDHPHGLLDLCIAVPAYAIYLYLNFSGFCDIVIGVSGLLNIEVVENFDRPFLSRNLQEFWTRWHMSLSTWIRDLAFTPLSKSLLRRVGPKSANHAIALSIFISFIGVGMWHGKGWNYVLYGALQGVGLVTVHYYTAWLKKRLGREKFAAYRASLPIRIVAVSLTFAYYSVTLCLIANNWQDIKAIAKVVQ